VLIGLLGIYYGIQKAHAARSAAAKAAKLQPGEERHPSNPDTILTRESRTPPNFTYHLKILVGFFQISTSLSFIVEIPWPSYFHTFISYFNLVNLDFIPWQSVTCVATWSYYTKFLIVALLPVGFLLFIALALFIPLFILDRCDRHNDDDTKRKQRGEWRKKYWKLLLFTLFLLYPGVSSKILSYFVCREVEGTSYLLVDFKVTCYDGEWNSFLPVAILWLIVYPFGVPLAFFLILLKNKASLQKPEVIQSLGFLYEAYNYDMWYFELIDCVHKLFLTSVLVFFPSDYQMPLGMVASVSYTFVILLKRPYVRRSDDRMHLFTQIEILLILHAALVLQNNVSLSGGLGESTIDIILSAIMISITIIVIICCILHGILFARRMWWASKRAEMLARMKLETGSGGGTYAQLVSMSSTVNLYEGQSTPGSSGGSGNESRQGSGSSNGSSGVGDDNNNRESKSGSIGSGAHDKRSAGSSVYAVGTPTAAPVYDLGLSVPPADF